jgi:signal transduction histidine kinase/CheY-like chemotaxis protein
MSIADRGGQGPWAPVVIERAGGGISRVAIDPVPLRAVRALARDATEILGVSRTTIWRLGPGGIPALCLTRFHRTSRSHDDDLAYPEELGREALRLLERLSILAMEDARDAAPATPALHRYLEESEVRAILAAPVRIGGTVVGFVAFEEVEGPRAWTAHDREQALAVAWRLEQHWLRQGTGVGLATNAGTTVEPGAGGSPIVAGENVADPDAPQAPAGPSSGASADAPTAQVDARPHEAAFGHRRELRARLQRLRTLERIGVLGTDAADRARHALQVQEGTLALLAQRLEPGGLEVALVTDAVHALGQARVELERFLEWTRRGPRGNGAVELNALVGELAVRLGKLTGERVGLLYAPSSEPVTIRAAPDLLARALEELVRNARFASTPGDRVRVAVQRGEEPGGRPLARLVVEDRGAGISSSDLPWIFEPWFTTRGEGADGMGLPIVQAIVEGHGGWVDVTSARGEGSRFVLNFPIEPLREVPDEVDGPTPAESGADVPGEPSPLALLIEDEPMLAQLLRRALEGAGFVVRNAEGGPEAVRLVRDFVHDASLLVTERVLADGSEGLSLLRTGRATQPYLAGIVVDRRLRADRDGSAVRRAREASRFPSDVPLLAQPLDPFALVALARELVTNAAPPGGASPQEPAGEGAGTLH